MTVWGHTMVLQQGRSGRPLAIALALLASVLTATSASATDRAPGDLFSFPKVVSGSGSTVYASNVSVVSADGSTMVMAWQEGTWPNYSLKAIASANGGSSWTNTVTVATGALRVPVLRTSSNGAVLLMTWMEGDGASCTLKASRSIDQGQTWSTSTTLASTAYYCSSQIPVAAAISPSGTDVVIAWYGTSGAPELVFSSNGGLTWNLPVTAPRYDPSDSYRGFAGAVALGMSGGNPVVAVPYGSTALQHGIAVAVTSDRGVTWNVHAIDGSTVWGWRPTGEVELSASADASTLMLVAGTSDLSSGYHAWASVSQDSGNSWSTPTKLSNATISAVANSATTSSDGTRMTVLWQQNPGDGEWHVMSRSSTDGGSTWGASTDLGLNGDETAIPRLAASADGASVAVGILKCPDASAHGLIQMHVSRNSGSSWTESCAGRSDTPWEYNNVGLAPVPWMDLSASGSFGRLLIATNSGNYKPVYMMSPAFALSYDANNGSGSVINAGAVVSGDTVTALNGCWLFTMSGQCPLSWNTKSDGTGTSIVSDGTGTFVMSADTVLYAQWVSSPSAPGTPAAPTLTVQGRQINVSGIAPASNGSAITGYSLQYKVSSASEWTTASPGPSPQNDNTYSYGLGLAAGTTYDVRIAAINAIGTGGYSEKSTATTASAPSAPATPTLTPAPGQMGVSWSAPSSDGGSAVIGYSLQYRVKDAVSWTTLTFNAATTSTTITGLLAGGQYDFQVAAENLAALSAYSSPITGLVPDVPSAPTLDGIAGLGSASLTWNTPNGNGAVLTSLEVQYTLTSAIAWTAATGGCASLALSATSCTMTGLTSGSGYSFRIRAGNAVGNGAWSNVVNLTPTAGVPDAPAAPTLQVVGAQINLSGTVPAGNGSPVTSFSVQYKVSTALTWTTNPEGPVPQYDNTYSWGLGLLAGTSYDIRVAAINAVGMSDYSQPSTATTSSAPPAPATPSLLPAPGQMTVNWTAPTTDPGDPVLGYRVQYKLSTSVTWIAWTPDITAPTTTAVITGLVAGGQYDFRVAARNLAGFGSYSSPITGLVPDVPAAPTLTGSAGVGNVTLTWNTPNGNGAVLTSLELQYKEATAVDWLPGTGTCATLATTAITCGMTGLTSGTTYSFRIRATNAVGSGAWSNTLNLTPTAAVPDAPLAPTLDVVGAQINVGWTEPAANGAAITGYSIQVKASTSNKWTTYTVLPSNNPYGLGLSPGTAYDVRVAAINSVGTGAYSPISTATTASTPSAPAVPSLLPAPFQMTVNWVMPASDPAYPVLSYLVQYKLSTSKTWIALPEVTVPTTTLTITGLTAGGQYDFQVAARNLAGLSAFSLPITGLVPDVPTAPTNVAGTVAPKLVRVTWTMPNPNGSTIDRYDVQIGTAKAGPFSPASGCTPTLTPNSNTVWTCDITPLLDGTAYYVQVRAHNAVGNGPWSAVAGPFTTPSAPSAPAAPTGTAGNEQVTLTWKAPANGGSPITGYLVQQRVSGTATWFAVTAPSCPQPFTTGLSCVIDGLTNNTGYVFRVAAVNAVGTGTWSAASAVLTPRLTVPATVTGILWTPATRTLSWQPNATKDQVTRYEYMVKLTSANKWPTAWTSNLLSTSVVLSALIAGSSYDVRVRAVNSVGAGVAGQISVLA